ncbi:MAG: hypothetical protein AAFW73_09150 [Bacteroidota bacterium]
MTLPQLAILLGLLTTATTTLAQPGICQLACNDSIQVALGLTCTTEILPDDLLEGNLDPDCLGPLEVRLFDAQDNLIPSSPRVDDTYEGQVLRAVLIDLNSTNFCEVQLRIEDQFVPPLTSSALQVPCGTDLEPRLPLSNPPVPAFEVLDTCQSVLLNISSPGSLADLYLDLQISHPRIGDLSAQLTSPGGIAVDLWGNAGTWAACTDAGLWVRLTAAARRSYADFESDCGAGDSYRAEGDLRTWLGDGVSGNWTFTLCNSSASSSARVDLLQLGIDTSATAIPFPLPAGTTISQNPSQQVTNSYTLPDFDNCSPAELRFSDLLEDQSCTDSIAQLLFRTWTLSDAYGNQSSTTDTFALRRLPPGSIDFPPNYDALEAPTLDCAERSPSPGTSPVPNLGWNTLPNGHPSPFDQFYPAPNAGIVQWFGTGVPRAQGCESISFDFDDLRIDVCSAGASTACFKILRTWTVTENCSGQTFSHQQTIVVADDEAPLLSGLADLTISTDAHGCTANWDATIPILTDNCNPLTNLSYALQSSAGDVRYDPVLDRFRIEQLPPGEHAIVYTASDCCGNVRTQTVLLTVADQVPPVATCVSVVTSSLTIDGTVRVGPESFNDLSTDNCGPLFYKVIRQEDLLGTADGSNANQDATPCEVRNGDDSGTRFGNQVWFDDYVYFCCEDVGQNDRMVVLRVFDRDPGAGPVAPQRMQPGGDLAGHFNDCMTQVLVADKLGPQVFCPADVTLDCSLDPTDLTLTGTATGFDNCSLDTLFFEDQSNVNVCGVGSLARIWTVRDHSGRTASCVQTITLLDTTPPVVTFPPSPITVECGQEFDLNITGQPQVVDDCALYGINRRDELHLFADSCLQKIVRIWTVMNFCSSEMFSRVQVIKIEDTTPPSISNPPADLTVDCDAIPSPVAPDFSDACDEALQIDFSETNSGGACVAELEIVRTWTATDDCLNSSTVVQRITVVDTTAPQILNVPADLTLECDQVAPSANPTTSDNCDPMVDLNLREDTLVGNCANNFTLVRTWTATDDCGNVQRATQSLSFEDTTPPVFLVVPRDTSLSCEEAIPTDFTLANDNCDPAVDLQLSEQIIPGACAAEQTIIRTWTATDACANQSSTSQTITISDLVAPELSDLPLDLTLECDQPLPTDQPTASDNCDPQVELNLVETRTDGVCPEDFLLTRTWTATDDCGNTTTHRQEIRVRDTTPPVFSNIPMDVTLECDGMPTDLIPTATDNCDTAVVVTLMESSAPDCAGNVTITRTWRATDNCDNSSTISQQITFTDTTPPLFIDVPADTTVSCANLPPVADVGAMDACDPMVTPSFSETRTDGDCPDRYTLTRTWTATDDCGNVATTSQVITVTDEERPSFSTLPADVTIACTDPSDPNAGGALAPPTVVDNCSPTVDLVFADQVTDGVCTEERTINRTWTATDRCGNSSSRLQVISVVDEVAPQLAGIPADLTVTCDALPPVATTITATDNCADSVAIRLVESRTDEICSDSYTLLREWIAEDNCGNLSRDTQRVVVVDTLAPVLLGIPADTTVLCSAIPDLPLIGAVIQATDNCDPTVSISVAQDTVNQTCTDEFTLIRRWSAVDNCGNVRLDSQLLTVIDTVPPSLLNIPADLTVTCDRLADTTSSMLVSATDNCDPDVEIQFSQTPDGRCPNDFFIVRRWTAIDNCGNISRRQQLITVLDTVAPVLQCPADLTIDIAAGIDIFTPRCDTFLQLIATATDNCADVITITNDSPFALDTLGDASGRYPIGVHVINFTAEDRCGNISTCSTTVTIRDRALPTLLCSDFELVLDPIDSTVMVDPGHFISFLADCAVDTLFFTAPIQTDTLVLDCSDVGQIFDISITVTDTSGNSITCTLEDKTVELPPSDPLFCGSVPPPISFMSGHLYTESSMPLPDVRVWVEGGLTTADRTDNDGRFTIGDLPTDANYTVRPAYNERPRDGITTLDLILISRHLLGSQVLDSPYKIIAADTDFSGSVNTLDLIEIQKLLLYLQDEFSQGPAWRFVAADYVFPDVQHPFSSPFPEVREYNGLGFGRSEVDFVGVKVGDVDGSVRNVQRAEADDREAAVPCYWEVENQRLERGEVYEIPVRVATASTWLGGQWGLDFDPQRLRFLGWRPAALGEGLRWNTARAGAGQLVASWYQSAARELAREEVLFYLRFEALEAGYPLTSLRMGDDWLAPTLYGEDLAAAPLDLRLVTEETVVASEGPYLFPNRPNPFREETTVAFRLPEAGEARLRVVDVAGRVWYERSGSYAAGYHEIELTTTEWATSGVLYYQLISAGRVATRKMVLLAD